MMDSPEESTFSCFKNNLLPFFTLLSIITGIGLGFGLHEIRSWTPREVMYVNFPGEIFLNMLQCLAVPLNVSSIVSALGSLDTRLIRKIGLRALIYYLITTLLAILLGIMLVIPIQPGEPLHEELKEKAITLRPKLPEDSIMDLISILDLISARWKVSVNLDDVPKTSSVIFGQFLSPSMGFWVLGAARTFKWLMGKPYRKWEYKLETLAHEDILGLVMFCTVLGITLGRMKEAGKPLLIMFQTLCHAIMIITSYVMYLTPVGVLFLVAGKIIGVGHISDVLEKLGLYTVTVLIGLALHGLIILPAIYIITTKKYPLAFIGNMGQALLTAFGTSLSSATLPVTLTCLENRNMIDQRVSRFVLPVGTAINLQGTVLYEAVATVFIAKMKRVPLDLGKISGIFITVTTASIGAVGIPHAGLFNMVIALRVLDLPAEDIALILAADWFLDRFRTTVNVLGDSFGAAIVEKLSLDDLENFSDAVDYHAME